MASITFLGACNGVTGSQYLIKTKHSTILLECGLIQGSRDEEKANEAGFSFDPPTIDAVVLSHAHLDHSGRLPKLAAEGYGGPIYATPATIDLLDVLLKDAASLAERDAEWVNKRRRRAGKDEIEPIYTLEDVENALRICEKVEYGKRDQITPDITVCFRDAGHILGSSIVELFINEDGRERKLVFSGDLGNSTSALLRDPVTIADADLLLCESTYGDRNHKPLDETLAEFEDIFATATRSGGNILIPVFAVGRSQEIIFRLGELYHRGLLPHMRVFLDSPMAIKATDIYRNYHHVFDRDDASAISSKGLGDLKQYLPSLEFSRTTEESMAINRIAEGAIILAGSGMCNGGRIRHHLKHNLWRRNSHVIIVGYQAMGTPGRALVDGVSRLKMAGEEIAVKATIHTIGGFSAHASQTQLLEWIDHFNDPKPEIYLVHGDPEAKQTLDHLLAHRGHRVRIPTLGEEINF